MHFDPTSAHLPQRCQRHTLSERSSSARAFEAKAPSGRHGRSFTNPDTVAQAVEQLGKLVEVPFGIETEWRKR